MCSTLQWYILSNKRRRIDLHCLPLSKVQRYCCSYCLDQSLLLFAGFSHIKMRIFYQWTRFLEYRLLQLVKTKTFNWKIFVPLWSCIIELYKKHIIMKYSFLFQRHTTWCHCKGFLFFPFLILSVNKYEINLPRWEKRVYLSIKPAEDRLCMWIKLDRFKMKFLTFSFHLCYLSFVTFAILHQYIFSI